MHSLTETTAPAPTVSVVVPVYRGSKSIGQLQQRIDVALAATPGDHEIIFVDDRGGDNSWEVIEALSRAPPHVHGVRLSRNFGQHAATLCGISHARGEWIVTIDEDLEQPPESIPAMLEKADQLLVNFGAITLLADRDSPARSCCAGLMAKPAGST